MLQIQQEEPENVTNLTRRTRKCYFNKDTFKWFNSYNKFMVIPRKIQ